MALLSTISKKKTGLIAAAAGGLLAGGFLTMPAAVAANGNDNGVGHTPVTICHHVGDTKDPYRVITPDASGVYDGHLDHQYADDIIPPFSYMNGQGQTISFAGQNWTPANEAILNNDCKPVVVKPPTTETTPPATETSTPPGTHSTPPSGVKPPASSSSPAVVPPATTKAPPAKGPAAVKPAPAKSMAVSAKTSANTAPADYTVPGLLMGSGTLLGAWLALTLWMKRRRGGHE
ncbi:hypothetical protein GCM10027449_02300 [Sinomonas notoginsengisoli]|uniref:hypothetical protein n=1 Tax=Sinomonas notoginsengisoli TaxID=1457311 RepID=UPI001F42024F|nr:hypothetical protein [Sinomonas notoginsengisoli]